eukprot:14379370-Alexandrium_andersonii.AAC.1
MPRAMPARAVASAMPGATPARAVASAMPGAMPALAATAETPAATPSMPGAVAWQGRWLIPAAWAVPCQAIPAPSPLAAPWPG